MMKEGIKRKTMVSLAWKTAESFSVNGIAFIVSVVIARLLDPAEYGILGIVTVFTSLATTFVQSGLNTALIQNRDVSDLDYSTVFWPTIAIAMGLYLALFLLAPMIANFYSMQQIVPVIRVLALILFCNAFNSIFVAKLSREMNFKKIFFSSLSATAVSGAVGITMAANGFGIWALVGHQLTNAFVTNLILSFVVKWKPRFLFSWQRFRVLFGFGSKLLLSSLIYTLNLNIRTLVIGKKYSSDMLGQYNRGDQIPQFVITAIDGAINSVLLPTYSTAQDDRQQMRKMMKRSIVTSSFVVFPAMVGLAVVAEPLIRVLLSDKWLPCVPFLQICCASYAFYPVHTANLQAINAMGRSDIFLKLEVLKMLVGLLILTVTVFCFDSIMAIAIGGLLATPISLFLNSFPNRRLLDYKLSEQLRDLLPVIALSCAMGFLVWLVSLLDLAPLLTLILQIIVGVVSYALLAWVTRMECFEYLKDSVTSLFRKEKE